LRGREPAGAMRGDDLGDRLSHVWPRSGGNSVKTATGFSGWMMGREPLLIALRDWIPGTNEASGVPLCTPEEARARSKKTICFQYLG
jgi:hypothetical protein